MKHARIDYNRIQDPDHKIPEDEPVFLLRAQDKTAAAVVRYWALLNTAQGGDQQLIHSANAQADLMERWPNQKLSDLVHKPEGAMPNPTPPTPVPPPAPTHNPVVTPVPPPTPPTTPTK